MRKLITVAVIIFSVISCNNTNSKNSEYEKLREAAYKDLESPNYAISQTKPNENSEKAESSTDKVKVEEKKSNWNYLKRLTIWIIQKWLLLH
ncbi:MAG: hypothetical protein FWD66_06385 [Paludibacter sp.]|nr:hypothetical protein [Paludibacter sp.]